MSYLKIAQDIVSGKVFSKTKLAFGVDGVATDVSANNPLPVVSGGKSVSDLPDGSQVQQIGSTTKKWVDDFGGNALDATLWDVTHVVAGMTVAVSNSELRVTMGTTINAECHLLSKEKFTIPFDVYASMKLSQRIVNNDVYIDIVEVDPVTGLPIVNGNLANDWRNRISARFQGTNAGNIILEGVCDESGLLNTVNNSTQQGTTGDFDLNLELRAADTILSTFATDSAAPRNNTPLRLSKQVPDPNKVYKLRLRFKNGGTAPASSTQVIIYRTLVADIQELVVELSSGRGDQTAAKAIAVNIAGGINMPVAQITSSHDVAVSFTRPADTNAYLANDVMGAATAALSFTNMAAANGGAILINSVQIEGDFAAAPATAYRLHLFSATPPSALADNAPFTLPSGDRAAYLGYIDIPSMTALGTTCYAEVNNIGKQVKCATASSSLWAYLCPVSGYTPGAVSEVYKITLHSVDI